MDFDNEKEEAPYMNAAINRAGLKALQAPESPSGQAPKIEDKKDE